MRCRNTFPASFVAYSQVRQMGSRHGSQQWQRVMTLGFFFPPMHRGLSTETLAL
jgi:hypothetical protein